MYMNSDKLEWAWSPIEFVGTTVLGTAVDAATASSMLVTLMARIEKGEVVVLDRSDGAPERDIRRWVGPEWSDPWRRSVPKVLLPTRRGARGASRSAASARLRCSISWPHLSSERRIIRYQTKSDR